MIINACKHHTRKDNHLLEVWNGIQEIFLLTKSNKFIQNTGNKVTCSMIKQKCNWHNTDCKKKSIG